MSDTGKPTHLIINSAFEEPRLHWAYDATSQKYELREGRRPAGFVRASGRSSKGMDDPGVFVPLELPNRVRERVRKWRDSEYEGVTGITKRLLEHWNDRERREGRRFFFCQLEAIETLIWLAEAPASARQGIDIPGDGGAFTRFCAKMATGSGKTIVMAMLIAWQTLNKVAYPQDKRYSKNFLVVAPGLTIRTRLQVLNSTNQANTYDEFDIVPPGVRDGLFQARILIKNWHNLTPLDPNAGPKVVKKGEESDEAFCRRVLADLSGTNVVVINDEAHHAWRSSLGTPQTGLDREEVEEATLWVSGLDKVHAARGILSAYDFTATPFVPSGKNATDDRLFDWIVSDFSLNDAIESGLVKTPRIVVRDDALPNPKDYKSRLYHIYSDSEVNDDLNRKAPATAPLPDLVLNAYYLLGCDWLATFRRWKEAGLPTPPVMISVANRTETAARIAYALEHGKIHVPELCHRDRLLHIDSKVLREAESREEELVAGAGLEDVGEEPLNDQPSNRTRTKQENAAWLRRLVDTVGKPGEPGAGVQNVISVAMLSEGWDARTVTHIMGLRAFTSQLLCEQVVGRGLRRASYDDFDPNTGFFKAEYVNVFGIPFTFLPLEGQTEDAAPTSEPKIPIEPDPAKARFALTWPNVIRINHEFKQTLSADLSTVAPLILSASDTLTLVQIAPMINGKPNVELISEIDLQRLSQEFRLQKIVFETARDIYQEMKPTWKGDVAELLSKVVSIVQRFLLNGHILIEPPLFNDDLRRRTLLTLNMTKIIQHIWDAIRPQNVESRSLVFHERLPIRSTLDMRRWYTGKPHAPALKSHINFCVYDSTWEASEAFELDHNPRVEAWAKNDHLGFEIMYVYRGIIRKYSPDFLVRLCDGTMLALEVKGKDSQENQAKQSYLREWIDAVNADGRFGLWACDISYSPADLRSIINKHSAESVVGKAAVM